jgi:hypothetical protein
VHVGTSSSSSSLNQAHAQAIVKVPKSEEKLERVYWVTGDYGWLKVEPSDERLISLKVGPSDERLLSEPSDERLLSRKIPLRE